MIADMEHPLYRGFISPVYCVYLQEQGLDIATPFIWRIINNQAFLHTHIFDVDNTNMQSIANVDYISPVSTLSAFTMADMELMIPDYFISRHGNSFTLSCDKMWGLEDVTDVRLPDAFALMLLQCFRKKITNVELATNKMMNL